MDRVVVSLRDLEVLERVVEIAKRADSSDFGDSVDLYDACRILDKIRQEMS